MASPLIIEKLLPAPAARVWKALTSKAEMKEWYFDLDEFRPEKGFRFSFSGKGQKGEEYVHLCEVTEVIPMKKLTYSWTYQHIKGYSEVSFELFEEGEHTRLKLTHTGLDSFPSYSPDFARESFMGGWSELIGKLLPAFLEKH